MKNASHLGFPFSLLTLASGKPTVRIHTYKCLLYVLFHNIYYIAIKQKHIALALMHCTQRHAVLSLEMFEMSLIF